MKNCAKALIMVSGIALSASAIAGGYKKPPKNDHTPPPVSVPEPATAALLGLGVAALALQRRLQKKDEEQ